MLGTGVRAASPAVGGLKLRLGWGRFLPGFRGGRACAERPVARGRSRPPRELTLPPPSCPSRAATCGWSPRPLPASPGPRRRAFLRLRRLPRPGPVIGLAVPGALPELRKERGRAGGRAGVWGWAGGGGRCGSRGGWRAAASALLLLGPLDSDPGSGGVGEGVRPPPRDSLPLPRSPEPNPRRRATAPT